MQISTFVQSALACVLLSSSIAAEARDLRASLAHLPKLIDSAESGTFVELIKAIDDVYVDGTIARQMFPFARSINSVLDGSADFHIPMLRNPEIGDSTLPYRFVSEPMGEVRVVLYSHVDQPLTGAILREALKKPRRFPYQIETLRGTPDIVPFPVTYANTVDQGLQKVAAKRIDAFLMAQEEADFTVRKLKLKSLHRSYYTSFEDVIVISKNPAGDAINAILSNAIRILKANGRWNAIYEKVHRPYEDWQPSQQSW
jgi:polar amino acid transport system substrate-binding protein